MQWHCFLLSFVHCHRYAYSLHPVCTPELHCMHRFSPNTVASEICCCTWDFRLDFAVCMQWQFHIYIYMSMYLKLLDAAHLCFALITSAVIILCCLAFAKSMCKFPYIHLRLLFSDALSCWICCFLIYVLSVWQLQLPLCWFIWWWNMLIEICWCTRVGKAVHTCIFIHVCIAATPQNLMNIWDARTSKSELWGHNSKKVGYL